MWPFRKKYKDSPATVRMLDWLYIAGISYNPENGTEVLAYITRDDIRNWLNAITHCIQKAYAGNPAIKNWLSGTFIVAGQEIEFYVMKAGGQSPLKLLREEQEKVKKLQKELETALSAQTKDTN